MINYYEYDIMCKHLTWAKKTSVYCAESQTKLKYKHSANEKVTVGSPIQILTPNKQSRFIHNVYMVQEYL